MNDGFYEGKGVRTKVYPASLGCICRPKKPCQTCVLLWNYQLQHFLVSQVMKRMEGQKNRRAVVGGGKGKKWLASLHHSPFQSLLHLPIFFFFLPSCPLLLGDFLNRIFSFFFFFFGFGFGFENKSSMLLCAWRSRGGFCLRWRRRRAARLPQRCAGQTDSVCKEDKP